MTKPTFDMDAALQALREGKDLTGKDGILTLLIKQLTEAAMQGELEAHLASEDTANRKNGSSRKTMKGPTGSFELDTPRAELELDAVTDGHPLPKALRTSHQPIRLVG